jgi:hypothetical protein
MWGSTDCRLGHEEPSIHITSLSPPAILRSHSALIDPQQTVHQHDCGKVLGILAQNDHPLDETKGFRGLSLLFPKTANSSFFNTD